MAQIWTVRNTPTITHDEPYIETQVPVKGQGRTKIVLSPESVSPKDLDVYIGGSVALRRSRATVDERSGQVSFFIKNQSNADRFATVTVSLGDATAKTKKSQVEFRAYEI